MRRRSAHWTIAVVLGSLMGLIPPVAIGNIAGSRHDFSASGWSGGKICLPCHTPHGADRTLPGMPLWNHEVSSATYTVYSSSTLNATPGQPSAQSKLCLSCHDGTVAVDSFGGNTGTHMIPEGRNLGTDLSTSHPISFTFDAALAEEDGELHDPSTAQSGVGGTIAEDLLFDDKVECASCHDVHDKGTGDYLLRKSNDGSALCLTCHDK